MGRVHFETRDITDTTFDHLHLVTMRGRWNWTRPEPRIYSYNTDPSSFGVGYSSSSSSSRSAIASSVAVGSESQSARSVRATTVAPASDSLAGYSGFYGKQLASMSQLSSKLSSSSSATASTVAVKSSTTVSEKTSRTVETERSSTKKVDYMAEHNKSLEYGKSSRSAALRRAEVHAVNSGKDPRHVMVPRNLDDDICKKVADIHMYDTSSMSSPTTGCLPSRWRCRPCRIARARQLPPARRSGKLWLRHLVEELLLPDHLHCRSSHRHERQDIPPPNYL